MLFKLSSACSHSTLMKDMCAECGADLRAIMEQRESSNSSSSQKQQEGKSSSEASISMVHSIPELKVSQEVGRPSIHNFGLSSNELDAFQEAQTLGKEDKARLHKNRKLVLLVDLDQTVIHTTNDKISEVDTRNVYHFQLYGRGSPWYGFISACLIS